MSTVSLTTARQWLCPIGRNKEVAAERKGGTALLRSINNDNSQQQNVLCTAVISIRRHHHCPVFFCFFRRCVLARSCCNLLIIRAQSSLFLSFSLSFSRRKSASNMSVCVCVCCVWPFISICLFYQSTHTQWETNSNQLHPDSTDWPTDWLTGQSLSVWMCECQKHSLPGWNLFFFLLEPCFVSDSLSSPSSSCAVCLLSSISISRQCHCHCHFQCKSSSLHIRRFWLGRLVGWLAAC